MSLTHLLLGGDNIKNLVQLEPLRYLENLKYLDLRNCEICNLENYRKEIFRLLPQLKFSDAIGRDHLAVEIRPCSPFAGE